MHTKNLTFVTIDKYILKMHNHHQMHKLLNFAT